MSAYARRRAAVLERLGDGVMVVPAAVHALRNNDTEYEFRQNSDLLYLTGFAEPEAVLVLTPSREQKSTMFLRPNDRALETWNGRRLGVDAAPGALDVDAAFPIAECAAMLGELLTGAERLFVRLGGDEKFDRLVLAALEDARRRTRRSGIAPHIIVDPGTILHEMRLVKDDAEIATMQRAADITARAHVAGMRATRPGLHEYELEAIIEYTYRTNGAQDVAYPSIVAGGDNATILHYNTNRDVLRAGDLVLVDSAAELDGYAADVTRTWPVAGRFNGEQRAVYEIVLAAQKAAIDEVRPGRSVRAAHDTALRILTAGLVDLGVLAGSVDGLIEAEAYKPYYMHGTGHWIGLDVHDVGTNKLPDGTTYRPLESGMAVTVEPGLYFARDADCDERWRGIGVRIEDDIVCTDDAPRNLTAAAPREIAEIEAIVGAEALAPVR